MPSADRVLVASRYILYLPQSNGNHVFFMPGFHPSLKGGDGEGALITLEAFAGGKFARRRHVKGHQQAIFSLR